MVGPRRNAKESWPSGELGNCGYRALLPAGFDGLLVAGKAIGGTHLSASAYRVQPIVASIGQAAGTAAALAALQRCPPRDVDRRALRRSVKEQGLLPAEVEA